MLWRVPRLPLDRIGVVALVGPIAMSALLLLHVKPSLLSRELKLTFTGKVAGSLVPSVSHLLLSVRLTSLLCHVSLCHVSIWMNPT
jgi:hypothetical protein